MKYLFIIISFVFVANTSNAQTRAPKKIREVFEQKYPDAQKVNWVGKGERQKEWTAHYWIENDSMQASYDHKGNWITTFTFIDPSELPEAVSFAIKDEYMSSEIIIAAKMEQPDFDGYGVAFMYKKDRWGVQITKEGKVIRRRLTTGGFYL